MGKCWWQVNPYVHVSAFWPHIRHSYVKESCQVILTTLSETWHSDHILNGSFVCFYFRASELSRHIMLGQNCLKLECFLKISDICSYEQKTAYSVKSLFFKYIFSCVWMFHLHVCMSVFHVPATLGGQKRLSEPLGLELGIAIIHCVGGVNQTCVLWKNIKYS